MSASFQRAWALFFDFKKYDLAERELRGVLVSHPDDAMTHALLGLCLVFRRAFGEAEVEVKEAIRLAPEMSYAHFVRARLYGARGQLGAARAAIEEAIRLSPMQPDYFSWLAAYLYDSGHRRKALRAAEKGLEIDAQHVGCHNMRALTLAKLGKTREASRASLSSLERDPVNAISHAIQGTTLLRQAEYRQARATFLEALRLDPLCDWALRGHWYARRGMVLVGMAETVGRSLVHVFQRRPGPEASSRSVRAGWLGSLVLAGTLAGTSSLAVADVTASIVLLALTSIPLVVFLATGWLPPIVGRLLRWVTALLTFLFIFVACILPIAYLADKSGRFGASPLSLFQVTMLVSEVSCGVGLGLFVLGLSLASHLADLSLPRRGS